MTTELSEAVQNLFKALFKVNCVHRKEQIKQQDCEYQSVHCDESTVSAFMSFCLRLSPRVKSQRRLLKLVEVISETSVNMCKERQKVVY